MSTRRVIDNVDTIERNSQQLAKRTFATESISWRWRADWGQTVASAARAVATSSVIAAAFASSDAVSTLSWETEPPTNLTCTKALRVWWRWWAKRGAAAGKAQRTKRKAGV